MTVDEAWRLLADTNHLNRTVGLPAVTFSPLDGPSGDFTRTARSRAFLLVPLTWTEYPFDWVRGRRYRVRREFHGGPLASLEGGIELEPAGDQTLVTAFADYVPANWTGRFLWRLGNATVTQLLGFCDEYLSRKAAGQPDPIPVPDRPPVVDVAALDRRLGELRAAPVREELIPLLRRRLVEGSDDQVIGVRAFELADTWGVDRLEVLRLLLYATKAGALQLGWQVMCPNCRIPKAAVATMSELPNRYHCDTCGIAYDVDFDQRVEVRFSVHPGVRRASDAVYCIGGPLRMPHVVAQQYLRPQEDRPLDVELEHRLRLRAVAGARTLVLRPGRTGGRTARVTVTYAEGRWAGPHSMTDTETGDLVVPAGARVVVRNQTGGPLLVVLEEVDSTGGETTATQVTALQEFRDLFGAEVLAPGHQVAVRDIAFVFSDLKGSTSLYEGVGDASAYSRVNRHFEFIRERIVRYRGAVVKTMGDAVMGAFHRLDDAAATAFAIQREIDAWCASQAITPSLVLKTGLHHGPVIAVNANGQLDYFGRTVNVAARLSAESVGGDVVLLAAVMDELGELPEVVAVERFQARLRGVEEELELVRARVRGGKVTIQ